MEYLPTGVPLVVLEEILRNRPHPIQGVPSSVIYFFTPEVLSAVFSKSLWSFDV